jgi:hypothetical protein
LELLLSCWLSWSFKLKHFIGFPDGLELDFLLWSIIDWLGVLEMISVIVL